MAKLPYEGVISEHYIKQLRESNPTPQKNNTVRNTLIASGLTALFFLADNLSTSNSTPNQPSSSPTTTLDAGIVPLPTPAGQ